MRERMEAIYGMNGQARDALTDYSTPASGSFYFAPSVGDAGRDPRLTPRRALGRSRCGSRPCRSRATIALGSSTSACGEADVVDLSGAFTFGSVVGAQERLDWCARRTKRDRPDRTALGPADTREAATTGRRLDVVGAVVDQHDARLGSKGGWPGFDEQRVVACRPREQQRTQHPLAADTVSGPPVVAIGQVPIAGGVELERCPPDEIVGGRCEAHSFTPVHPVAGRRRGRRRGGRRRELGHDGAALRRPANVRECPRRPGRAWSTCAGRRTWRP